MRGNDNECVIQHNTFHATDRGIQIETSESCIVKDNIVSTLNTDQSHFGFEDSSSLRKSTFTHNLAGIVLGRFAQVGNASYLTLAAFNAGSSNGCENCVEGDPVFVDPAIRNFAIGARSAARDVGSGDETWYDLFEKRFGVNIKKDFYGVTRPQNGRWDIGAAEFDVSNQVAVRIFGTRAASVRPLTKSRGQRTRELLGDPSPADGR